MKVRCELIDGLELKASHAKGTLIAHSQESSIREPFLESASPVQLRP